MEISTGNSLQEKLYRISTKYRHCWYKLMDYLKMKNDGRVCGVGGLIGTGKTTMMLQAILEINQFDKCLLLECDREDNLQEICDIINLYQNCKYVFIDNFTWVSGIGACSVLADRYAYEGRKIVLTGDELQLFRLLEADVLLDRMHLIDTTYVSFSEFHELSNAGLKEYIHGYVLFHQVVDLPRNIMKSYSLVGQKPPVQELTIANALHYAAFKYYFDEKYDSDFEVALKVCCRAGFLQNCNGNYVFLCPCIPYLFRSGLELSDEFVYSMILKNIVLLYLFRKYNSRDIKVKVYDEYVLKEDLVSVETIVYQFDEHEIEIPTREKIEKKTGTKIKKVVLVTMENAELLLKGERDD